MRRADDRLGDGATVHHLVDRIRNLSLPAATAPAGPGSPTIDKRRALVLRTRRLVRIPRHGIEARETVQAIAARGHAALDSRPAARRVRRPLSPHDGSLPSRAGRSAGVDASTFMRARQPGESALLLLDAIDLLKRANVSYAVVGAMAASVHGVVRASMDAYAVLSVGAGKLGEIERQFRGAGFQTELRHGDPDDPIAAVLALSDTFGNRVDLLVGLRGLESAAFSRVLDVPFQGERLRVIGREDFIAMKLFAHGPQDLADAEFALAAGKDSIDVGLLRRLTRGFGHEAAEALERLLREANGS